VSALPPVIQALLRPEAYPHPVDRVDLVQTHISYVLLAGEYVYKIKKTVDFGFLDYSTLAKRRYYCGREVALNSRLCDDTYLGVLPIRELDGEFVIGGKKGRTVEYAVWMRRLPEDRMMHRLLERDKVTPAMVEQIAEKLAPFHQEAETSPRMARYGDWAIRYNWQENIDQWQTFIGRTISAEQDRILQAYGEAFFARKAEVLARRVQDLKIRRVHADLRSDAVCFVDGVCIFDCVEFSRRLSLLDVARDVGFLAMDLDYRGRSDLSGRFVERYMEISGDDDLEEVLDFYACYSACVRGKVESFLLDQPEVPDREKRRAEKAAKRYFELACRYAEDLRPAVLAITCGLAGTGKSTLASALADEAGFEMVSSDRVRKELAGLRETERRLEDYGKGIYSPEFTQRTYDALLERAREALQAGRSVVVDATFIRREHRKAARRLARETGAQFACLLLETDENVIRKRLGKREREDAGPSDARWQTYVAQKRRFQRPRQGVVLIDAGKPLRSQVGAALRGLRTVSPLSV
jgi:uncharacterized protein